MDVLQDTRDRVITLAAEFAQLNQRVEKNSKILEELHAKYIGAKASLSLGRSLVSAGRYVVTGMSGGGFLWLVQNWPKGAG
jgi:hypothetical protein